MNRMVRTLMALAVAVGLAACATKQKVAPLSPAIPLQKEEKTVVHGVPGKVYSGDTLEMLNSQGKVAIVRLYGIIAPIYDEESPNVNQPFGKEARDYLETLVAEKELQIHVVGVDYQNQLVAGVFDGGKCLNEEMLKAGLAWSHVFSWEEVSFDGLPRTKGEGNGYCSKWTELSQSASREKKGLYGEAHYISPQAWKKKHDTWLRRNLGAAAGVAEVVLWLSAPIF